MQDTAPLLIMSEFNVNRLCQIQTNALRIIHKKQLNAQQVN